MPYFDEAPAKFGETKEKNTVVLEDNSSSNRNIDERLLRLKMKQVVQKEFFHQLEPVEVVEVEEEADGSKFGNIYGRYIYSEYNIPKENVRANGSFKPINSNILQMPLPGELVIGLEFNDERYYFSAMNPSPEVINNFNQTINQSVDNENETIPPEIQTNFSDISTNVKGVRNSDNKLIKGGKTYRKPYSLQSSVSNFEPGDTLIQGRHNNYIQFSSNQSFGNEKDSGNIMIGAFRKTGELIGGSEIHLTTREQPNYPDSVREIGDSMNKSQYNPEIVLRNKDPFETQFSRPSIFMNSARIVLYAGSDDIAIFSNQGNVHIKGEKVQIKNSRQVSIGANEVVNETKKLYRLKEDLKSGNVLLLPEGVVERGRNLAREHRKNILEYINKLNSLIPAAIPGTRSVPNPAWFKNIREGIQNAKEALETNKLIVSLKWLDFDTLKTYTIDELREAWSPVPGMADVIGKLSNLKSLVEEVDKLKEDYAVAKAKFEEFKAIAQNPADYFESLILAKVETLTFDDFIEINATINDFETAGGDINQIEGGPELKKDSQERLAANEALQGLTGDERQTQQEFVEKENKKYFQKLQAGLAGGFNIAIVKREMDVDAQETTIIAAESLSSAVQAGEDAQKNLENA